MIKKLSILALGLAIALPSAFATTLEINVQETGVVGALGASSTGTGVVFIPAGAAYGDFTLNSVSGLGTPTLSNPNLNLQTLDVTAATLAAPHTLTIMLTETGITGIPNPFSYLNSFDGNLQGVTSETITDYTDPSNAAWGMADKVATTTFTTNNNADSFNLIASAATSSMFSETQVIVATFGATTAHPDSLDSSVFMGSTVPEPASLALIGTGLLGLALVSRRRSAKK